MAGHVVIERMPDCQGLSHWNQPIFESVEAGVSVCALSGQQSQRWMPSSCHPSVRTSPTIRQLARKDPRRYALRKHVVSGMIICSYIGNQQTPTEHTFEVLPRAVPTRKMPSLRIEVRHALLPRRRDTNSDALRSLAVNEEKTQRARPSRRMEQRASSTAPRSCSSGSSASTRWPGNRRACESDGWCRKRASPPAAVAWELCRRRRCRQCRCNHITGGTADPRDQHRC